MKRRDLEKHLRDHGCEFERHGGDHDVWINRQNSLDSAVPRHREIKPPMVRAICKQLDIPQPRKVS